MPPLQAQLTNLQEEMEALKEKNAELSQAVNKHMGLSDLERESAIEAAWKALREKDIGRRVVLHGGPENVCRSG